MERETRTPNLFWVRRVRRTALLYLLLWWQQPEYPGLEPQTLQWWTPGRTGRTGRPQRTHLKHSRRMRSTCGSHGSLVERIPWLLLNRRYNSLTSAGVNWTSKWFFLMPINHAGHTRVGQMQQRLCFDDCLKGKCFTITTLEFTFTDCRIWE